MARKTLREAAIDVLQASAKQGQEPMHKVQDNGDPSAAVVDLGGATWQNPMGNAIGSVAAGSRGQMQAPKGPATKADDAPKAGEHPKENDLGEPEKDPEGITQVPPPKGTEEVKTEETDEAIRRESIMAQIKSLPIAEDMAALFNGSQLSEEFQTKARTIFESAVVARAMVVVEALEKQILEAAEEAVEESKRELEEQIDSYLGQMVNEWMSKNEVAIEKGLKTEITEEFLAALHGLFTEHYMSVPEEKVDVVEALTEKVESLEARLNETLNTNVELNKRITEANKAEVLASVSEGLTATQVEKFKTLAEGVEFVTADEYVGKLKVIREQYFTKQVNKATTSPVVIAESVDPSSTDIKEIPANMTGLVAAMSRFAKNS